MTTQRTHREHQRGSILTEILWVVIAAQLVLLLLTHPDVITRAGAWLDDTQLLWKAWMFLAAQPLVLGFVFLCVLWMKRRAGPFSVEREIAPGHWRSVAVAHSLKDARALAREPGSRICNGHGHVLR